MFPRKAILEFEQQKDSAKSVQDESTVLDVFLELQEHKVFLHLQDLIPHSCIIL